MDHGSAMNQEQNGDRLAGGHPNLFDDTFYRRARRSVARAAHAADEWLHARLPDRAHVLFEAASPMSLAVVQPVLDRLHCDPRLAFWYTTCDGAWNAESIFATVGTPDRVIASTHARWMKFDAYINTDFWNMTWLYRSARRIHFFHGVAGKYGLDAPTRIAPVVTSFDRLMFANRDRRRKYAAAGLVDPDAPQAPLIGYPKVDCLVDGSLDGNAIRRQLGLDETAPTVLYAPTWSPYSSLNRNGLDIIQALVDQRLNVIVKLHDRSLDNSERASGRIDWRRQLARFRDTPHVHVATGANASPYMCAADALVTDHSSIGFEYTLLDRPLVIVDCPELIRNANVSHDKVALIRGAAAVVSTARQTAAAVLDGLAHPQRHSQHRRAIAADFFYGAGGATDRAVQCIYQLLGMAPPQRPVSAIHVATVNDAGAAADTRTPVHV